MGRAREGVSNKAQQDAPVSLLAVNPTAAHHVLGQVQGTQVCFMLDTGAVVSLLSKDVWDRLGHSQTHLTPWTGHKLVGVEGSPIKVSGVATVDVTFAGSMVQGDFLVADSLRAPAILGLDFLERNRCVIDTARRTLNLQELVIPLQSPPRDLNVTTSEVAIRETLKIPAFSERETMACVIQPIRGGTWLLESAQRNDVPALVAGAVVTPVVGGDGAVCVPVRLANPTQADITIHQGTRIARAELLEEAQISAVHEPGTTARASQQGPEIALEKQGMLWEAVERTAEDVDQKQKEQLYNLLLGYADIFASSDADLGRTGKLKHSIDVGDNNPIRQPARRVPPYRREEVHKQLQDMLSRDVIQPSTSPWASPVVRVQKKDGSI